MKKSLGKLSSIAANTGFRPDTIEKIVRLMGLLNAINSHPFLKGKLALKGGTALNVFVFSFPRLSVDIDLNYIGTVNRDEMLAEKPKIEQALQAVFSREDYNVKRVPDEHAGGKWRLGYQNAADQPGNLEVDLNFMFRLPLCPPSALDSHTLGDYCVRNFPVLNLHELIAGKLAALFGRNQARDLFDTNQLLALPNLNIHLLRTIFVAYGAMNRRDWRTISPTDISFDADDLDRMLVPVLNRNISSSLSSFGQTLVDDCKKKMVMLLPFTDNEKGFLNAIQERGEIKPDLLTDDSELQNRIVNHPLLQWKALNVRKHFNLN